MWRKDGEKIVDGEDGYYLPGDHFNRLLIIKHVTQEHHGNYTCTAYPTSNISNRDRFEKKYLTNTTVISCVRCDESLVTCLRFEWPPVGPWTSLAAKLVKL